MSNKELLFYTWHLYQLVTQNKVRTQAAISIIDLFKALDYIESSAKLDFFLSEKTYFFHTYATCSVLPSYISTMCSTAAVQYNVYCQLLYYFIIIIIMLASVHNEGHCKKFDIDVNFV